MQAPKLPSSQTSLSEARDLLRSPQLAELLRARLVQLAFTQDNATSIKAIELLRDMPSSDDAGDLTDNWSVEQLLTYEAKATAFLRAFEERWSEGGEVGGVDD